VATHFALSAVGRDRPGIAAAVSEVLFRHGVNVEDSQMAILRGHFTMMLVVAAPDGVDADALRSELTEVGRRLALEAVLLSPVEQVDPADYERPSHIVTVYGADHPGILHAATTAIAALEADITDLQTRLVGEDREPIYAILMEVALPAAASAEQLEAALAEVGQAQGVDVSVRPLEQDAL
jgi:glycine cleavage system transcriptional repressor